jgi:hypothetical protein
MRPERDALAALADLLTSGRKVSIVTADARRRAGLAGQIARFSPTPHVVCCRCGTATPPDLEGVLITDWPTLAVSRRALHAELVAAIDPPPGEAAIAAIEPSAEVFALWGLAESEFALSCFRAEWDTRAAAGAIYRGLRELSPQPTESELAVALAGAGDISRTPMAIGRAIRVLTEVGLVEYALPAVPGGVLEVRVVSSARTDLDRSAAYRRYLADHRAGETFLSQQQRPAA